MNDTPSGSADLLAGLAALAAAEDLTVGKDGFNKHFGYGYMTEAALFTAARAALADVGLSGTLSFEAGQHETIPTWNKDGQERPGILATVTARLTIRDREGHEVSMAAFGQGLDNADKAYYKAMTGAAKYVVQKALMIAVESEDTDEGHSGDVAGRSRAGGSGGAASSGQLGFVCSLIRKAHIVASGTDNADVEAIALRLARMRGDTAETFQTISKPIAHDLIERLQKIPPEQGPAASAKLVEWETENGVAVPVASPAPASAAPAAPAAPADDDDIPF